MKQFFQKHSKIIMGIVSILLMFFFAMPGVRQPGADEKFTAVIGTIDGKKIIQNDLDIASSQLHGMQDMPRLAENSLAWGLVQREGSDDKERALYWALLKEEARKYESADYTEASARTYVDAYGINTNLAPQQLANLLSDFETVESYIQFLVRLPRPATAMELQADKEMRKLQVWYLTLDAQNDWQQIGDPTETQIQAQFKAYQDMVHTPIPAPDAVQPLPPADKDGHHYPFGYKYPDQVEVDYVLFDRKAISALVTAKDDATQKLNDKTAAFKEFSEDHPEKYTDKKWEDVKDSLIQAQVDSRVSRRMKIMANAFMERTSKAASTGVVDYAALVKDLAGTSEFMGYQPQVKHTSLMSAEDLAKVEGIGGASFVDLRNTEFAFPKLATSVPELVKLGENDPLAMIKPALGTEGPPLSDAANNNYIYRVTKAVPTHEAKSIDEDGIRKQVIEDYKKLEAYKKNAERMKALVKSAGAGDLDALAAQEKLPIAKPPELTQLNAIEFQNLTQPEVLAANSPKLIAAEMTIRGLDPLKEVLSIPGFTEKAFALAAGPGVKPAAELDNDGTLRCYVMQVQKVTQPTGTDFDLTKRVQLHSESQQEGISFMRDYLTMDGLKSRLKWKAK